MSSRAIVREGQGVPRSESQPLVLALDAAGSSCSAAVAVGGDVLAAESVAGLHGHAERLMPLLDAIMCRAGVQPAALDCVAATCGPGSFTGIRVGLAAAHGIALAAGAQLIGLTSFEAVAAGAGQSGRVVAGYLLVALESRREEFFIQFFDRAGEPRSQPAAVMPGELRAAVEAVCGPAPVLIAGDAAARAASLLSTRAGAAPLENSEPIAVAVLRAALHKLGSGERHDMARPLYLRPPQVTFSKARPAAGRDR